MARFDEDEKHEIYDLLHRVFLDELSRDEFKIAANRILKLEQKADYPKFVWKSIHYIVDADIRAKDIEYAEAMRDGILSAVHEYFS